MRTPHHYIVIYITNLNVKSCYSPGWADESLTVKVALLLKRADAEEDFTRL